MQQKTQYADGDVNIPQFGHRDHIADGVARAIGIGFGAGTGDHLDPRMLLEPVGERVCGAIREQGHRLATLQINQHGTIGLAFAQGKIVHTEHSGSGACRDGLPTKQA